MLKNKDKYINCVVDGFQSFHGRASCYCFNEEIIPELVEKFITLFNAKAKRNTFIAVNEYKTRRDIVHYLNQKGITEYNGFKWSCLTVDYIKPHYDYKSDLCIIIGVNADYPKIFKLKNESTFTLCVLTENLMQAGFNKNVKNLLPMIDTTKFAAAIKYDYIYSPVEEHLISCSLTDEELEQYNQCTQFITNIIAIFGDIKSIEKCRIGDAKKGLSAIDYVNIVAANNGWRNDLDINIPYMKQIDDIYNPNSLLERANAFFNVTRERREIVNNALNKYNIILDIVKNHRFDKTIIISKNGKFAANICDYINKYSENGIIACGHYHDNLEPCIARDDDGNVIYVKSGANKGQPKIAAARAQCTQYERLFNADRLNILSIKNSSDTRLNVAANVVILTSYECDNIMDIKRRFNHVNFKGSPLIVYRVYCENTIEQERIKQDSNFTNITIIDESEKNILYDENNGVIIL